MNILILSIVVFIALVLTKDSLDMCKTRAEIDMIYRKCKYDFYCADADPKDEDDDE